MAERLDVVSVLEHLVSIDSANPFQTVHGKQGEIGIGNEAEINVALEGYLKGQGFKTTRQIVQPHAVIDVNGRRVEVPERFNVLAEKGSGEKSLLLAAHTDTVEAKSGWKTNPLRLSEYDVEDEVEMGRRRLTGLGVNDMKAGIATILAAGWEDPPPGWKIKVAFVVDEEFWSFGAMKLSESDFLNDVAFALVPEIGETSQGPDVQWIGLGRLGRTEFIFDIEGRACHGADVFTSPEVINAVHQSIKLERAVVDYCESARKEFEMEGVSTVNSAFINLHEGGRGILTVPERARFIVDRSLLPGESAEEEKNRLQEIIDRLHQEKVLDSKVKITVSERPRPTPTARPYFIPPSNPVVQYVTSIVREFAPTLEYGIGRSVADENRLAECGIPTLSLGPHGRRSHTPDEWLDRESLLRVSKIYSQVIRRLDKFAGEFDREQIEGEESVPQSE